MVKLTEYEQKMLDGEMGPFKQRAIRKIVDYANALGAEELCEVTKATVYFGYHAYLDAVKSEDYDEIFSEWFCAVIKSIIWRNSAIPALRRPAWAPATSSVMSR